MSYHFNGVFAKCSPDQVAMIASQILGFSKTITEPFTGIGISFENDIHDKETIKEILVKVSDLFPDVVFVYIYYSTFGGPCEYCCGFAYKNGIVINNSEIEMEDDSECIALRKLAGYLDVNLN